MEYDQAKVDEITLALMFLTSLSGHGITYAIPHVEHLIRARGRVNRSGGEFADSLARGSDPFTYRGDDSALVDSTNARNFVTKRGLARKPS